MSCLASYGESAEAVGHRVSRAPRETVLRKAQLLHDGNLSQVIVRNVSSNGAMIEGCILGNLNIGTNVSIDIFSGKALSATIRWSDNGKAGISFNKAIGQNSIV